MRLPDLQELVARFGGYHKITAEAWTEYDAAIARYRVDQISRLREEQVRNKFRAPVRKPAGKPGMTTKRGLK